ncbi:MAG: TRAP transporter small permease subunit [Magnetovibrionaceae bacterium]
MEQIAIIVRSLDKLNDLVGRSLSWLTLAMVLVTFAVVILRYVFSIGWVAMQESYVWMHGIVFMGGAAYTLLHNGHVRVDILYRGASPQFRAKVDIFGVCFLMLPVLILVAWVSTGYILTSWAGLEESREAGGLPGLFLLKSMIWVFSGLMSLQAVALALRSGLVLAGYGPFLAEAETMEGEGARHE